MKRLVVSQGKICKQWAMGSIWSLCQFAKYDKNFADFNESSHWHDPSFQCVCVCVRETCEVNMLYMCDINMCVCVMPDVCIYVCVCQGHKNDTIKICSQRTISDVGPHLVWGRISGSFPKSLLSIFLSPFLFFLSFFLFLLLSASIIQTIWLMCLMRFVSPVSLIPLGTLEYRCALPGPALHGFWHGSSHPLPSKHLVYWVISTAPVCAFLRVEVKTSNSGWRINGKKIADVLSSKSPLQNIKWETNRPSFRMQFHILAWNLEDVYFDI